MTTVMMGPYATQILGDFGADVIKVEVAGRRRDAPGRRRCATPAWARSSSTSTATSAAICLDLKKADGREALLRLIATGRCVRLQRAAAGDGAAALGYDVVSAINPRIIYAGVFGFGQDGPYAAQPAYDDLIQGATALPCADRAGRRRRAALRADALVDRIVGLYARRRHPRQPRFIATAPAKARRRNADVRDDGRIRARRSHGRADLRSAARRAAMRGCCRRIARPYPTKDGYVCALVYTDKQWKHFLRRSAASDLRRPSAFATFAGRAQQHRRGLRRVGAHPRDRSHRGMDGPCCERPTCPSMPMNDLDGLIDDPHLARSTSSRRSSIRPRGEFAHGCRGDTGRKRRSSRRRLAPRLGEHTAEILARSRLRAGRDRGTGARRRHQRFDANDTVMR